MDNFKIGDKVKYIQNSEYEFDTRYCGFNFKDIYIIDEYFEVGGKWFISILGHPNKYAHKFRLVQPTKPMSLSEFLEDD